MDAALPSARSTLDRWLARWHRYGWLVAVASFGLGLASLLLVHRAERVAQWLVVLLPLSWLAMLAEGWIARRWRLSPLVLRYGLQAVHQESLFFVLPFFLASTTWTSRQAAFSALLIVAAGVSMIDPLYYGQLARRRWAYLFFHAFSVFVTALAAGPMLWHLTTGESLQLACACMALLSLPSAAHAIDRSRASHWLLLLAGCGALGVGAWLARGAIPPATLRVDAASISLWVDVPHKAPGPSVLRASVAAARRSGLHAFTAIHAPRGLSERVVHRWLFDGVEYDRIMLDITGGREEGYRAWSRKIAFPEDPRGTWTVEVITEGGQLIGVVRVVLE